VIDTHIPGDPASIRAVATWLRSSLSAGVSDATTRLYRARSTAASGWVGTAGSAFGSRMTSAGSAGDMIAADAEWLSTSFNTYADALHTAHAGMRRARKLARDAGLTVTNNFIQAPDRLSDPLSHTAWKFVTEEASRARGIVSAAEELARDTWRDLKRKKYLLATDVVSDAAEQILDARAKSLQNAATRLAAAGEDAAKAAAAADKARGLARKLPYVGYGITALDIGLSIADGTPPAKAIAQGVAGATASTVVATAVTGALSPIATPWVGVPAGLIAGVGAGYIAEKGAGLLYDTETKIIGEAYDKLVPEKVKDKIPDKLKDGWNKLFD
jgi:hypothetical protein